MWIATHGEVGVSDKVIKKWTELSLLRTVVRFEGGLGKLFDVVRTSLFYFLPKYLSFLFMLVEKNIDCLSALPVKFP